MKLALRLHITALALALLLPAAASASPRQVVAFEAPRELLSFQDRDQTLDEIRDFGVTQVRQLVYWRDFAPRPSSKRKPSGFNGADPAAYPTHNWDRLDALVASARDRGIALHFNLTGPVPRWATESKRDNLTSPIPKEFRAWATAVGRRYGDAIATWSIWNEPNHPSFLKPQYSKGRPVSPGLYRRLYQEGVKGLKATAANRGDTFLIGETAPRGNSQVVFPLDFLRRMVCLDSSYKRKKRCVRLDADGYAHHAYTTSKGPRFVPSNRDDVTLGVLSRLSTALDRAGAAGGLAPRLPIYLTEFGIQSRPDRIQGVSFSKQAAYLAVAEHMAYVNPRVRSFSQYLMSDDRPRASKLNRYAGFESGLRTSKGSQEAGLQGVPAPARGRELRPLGRALGPRAAAARGDHGRDRGRPARREHALHQAADAAHHRQRRLRDARDPPQGPALPRPLDLAVRQALRRRGRPRVLSLDIRRNFDVCPIGVWTRCSDDGRPPITYSR